MKACRQLEEQTAYIIKWMWDKGTKLTDAFYQFDDLESIPVDIGEIEECSVAHVARCLPTSVLAPHGRDQWAGTYDAGDGWGRYACRSAGHLMIPRL